MRSKSIFDAHYLDTKIIKKFTPFSKIYFKMRPRRINMRDCYTDNAVFMLFYTVWGLTTQTGCFNNPPPFIRNDCV